MRIGISRPSFEEGDNEEIFRLAAAMGFEGVQVKPHQYDPLGIEPERFRAAYGELAALGRGGAIVYPGHEYRTWLEKLPRYLEFVKGIGGEQLCICAGIRREHVDADGVRGIANVLNELGKRAVEAGAVISLHNHADTIVETVEDIAALFEHIDPQYCGLTFDTAHAAKGGVKDLAGTLEHYRAFVNNVHLKDVTADGAFCPIGTGTLDLPAVLAKLRAWDYKEWLIVDEESKGVPVREAFEASVGFLRRHGVMI